VGRRLALALAAVVLLLAGGGAWLFRVEDIPDELPAMLEDPTAVEIPPVRDEPPLKLAELRGRTAFFVVVGASSGDSPEGEQLNRALNRWIYPETTVGYIIGDAEGFEVFREKVAKILERFASEMRYPLYVDFAGDFMRTFQLPKGHHGFVVLGPDGSVLLRKSGGIEGAALEEVRAMLGAREPDPGPPAPALTVGSLDLAACQGGYACAILFLGHDVARSDVPGIDDGFEGDDDEMFAKMRDPAIRLVSSASKMRLESSAGVIVGRTRDLELETWERLEDAPEARAAFQIGPQDSAIVVIAEGRVEFRKTGLVPVYEWGRVADLLGVEINDRKPAKGK